MDKTVLITGASSGIGRACALRLVREGFVVFAGVRKVADAESLLLEGGQRLNPIMIDVTDGDSIRAAALQVEDRVGARGLDGLVNNAGIGVTMPVEYLPLDLLRHQLEVNVIGQIAVTQALMPLIRQAHGRIVNMGSVGSHLTIPFGGALCASKYAFASLNDALRLELHPFGIHVSMVEPGAIVTPAVDKTLGDVEGVIAQLPIEGAARYGDLLREFTRRATEREQNGSTPDVVADAVVHALTAKRPHARYPVGKLARLMVTMPRILSDGLLDRVRYRLFGIPGPSAPQS
jgi:NAD(P)-dependent dehydrogenase (short-subunit alcohol dehydrogenase family)